MVSFFYNNFIKGNYFFLSYNTLRVSIGQVLTLLEHRRFGSCLKRSICLGRNLDIGTSVLWMFAVKCKGWLQYPDWDAHCMGRQGLNEERFWHCRKPLYSILDKAYRDRTYDDVHLAGGCARWCAECTTAELVHSTPAAQHRSRLHTEQCWTRYSTSIHYKILYLDTL